jgi:hypothetical protein
MASARWLLLFALGCSGCSRAIVGTSGYVPAIVRDSLPPGKGAVTVCAENNVPYVVLDWATKGTDMDEANREHDMVHVRQIMAYRGGCWPFMYRYKSDSAFKSRIELEAYCAWGRWLMERDREPMALWARIDSLMQTKYATKANNCLYEDWPQ